jgi:hypothetical protein
MLLVYECHRLNLGCLHPVARVISYDIDYNNNVRSYETTDPLSIE